MSGSDCSNVHAPTYSFNSFVCIARSNQLSCEVLASSNSDTVYSAWSTILIDVCDPASVCSQHIKPSSSIFNPLTSISPRIWFQWQTGSKRWPMPKMQPLSWLSNKSSSWFSNSISKGREPGMKNRFQQSLETLILQSKNGQWLVFNNLHHLKLNVLTMVVQRSKIGVKPFHVSTTIVISLKKIIKESWMKPAGQTSTANGIVDAVKQQNTNGENMR